MNAQEVNVAAPEAQFDQADVPLVDLPRRHGTLGIANFVDPPAFLLLVRSARVEHHSVAGFERGAQSHLHGFGLDARDFTEVHPALLAEACMNRLLILDASEPAAVKDA